MNRDLTPSEQAAIARDEAYNAMETKAVEALASFTLTVAEEMADAACFSQGMDYATSKRLDVKANLDKYRKLARSAVADLLHPDTIHQVMRLAIPTTDETEDMWLEIYNSLKDCGKVEACNSQSN